MFNHGGNIRQVAEKYGLRKNELIDFSASINPWSSAGLRKGILSDLGSIRNYPDPEHKLVKEAVSSAMGIGVNNLLVTNGSIEAIFLLAAALQPKKALIPVPAFSEYERAVSLYGAKCIFLKTKEEDNFKLNFAQAIAKLRGIDLVFLCNPNNPTGSLLARQEALALARACEKQGVLLVVDEVFMDFVDEADQSSLIKFASKSKRVIVLRSLTKMFALAGLRLGFMVGAKELINKLSKYQYPWSVNCLAQSAGEKAIKDSKFIRKSRNYLSGAKDEFMRQLTKISWLKPFPASANFILCKILETSLNSQKLCVYCAKQGLLLRDCSNFRGLSNRFFRIAVKAKAENKKLIKALQGFV